MTTAAGVPRPQLLRILGVAFGIAVTLGNMIGSGILRSPQVLAATLGSTAIILGLWVAGALHSALSANALVELGTALPQVGGPYVYARRGLGDVAGLIVGWSVWASKLAGIASGAVSFADFLAILVPSAASHQAGVAVGLQLLLYGANISGLREGRVLQEATSFAKGALLFAFAIAAVFVVPASANAYLPPPGAAITFVAVMGAYKLIRGAYSGWDAQAYFAEESRSPEKTLPRGLFIGVAVTSALYVGVNWALLHAMGPRNVAATALPFMSVLQSAAGPFASAFFAVGAMVAVLSVANANIMSAPRVILALARDRLLPHQLSGVNKGGSPYSAFIMTAVGSIALALTGQFVLVFGLIGTLDTVAGLLVMVAFFALRWREPQLPRPFRAIGYPVLPALALLIEVVLLFLFNAADVKGFVVAAAICVACIPFAWIARRGRLDKNNSSGTN